MVVPSNQDIDGKVSFSCCRVGYFYFASLRHSSNVVRDRGVRAEGMSTFEGCDR